jgi:uncharacterized protein (DUF608 family)
MARDVRICWVVETDTRHGWVEYEVNNAEFDGWRDGLRTACQQLSPAITDSIMESVIPFYKVRWQSRGKMAYLTLFTPQIQWQSRGKMAYLTLFSHRCLRTKCSVRPV